MGQIVSAAAKPKRCNKNQLSQLGVLAAGLHVLVSSDNSMNAAGQGNFDCYILGDGTTAASALPLHKIEELYTDDTSADLEFVDESGNVILRLEDGEIVTKNFNSANTLNAEENGNFSDLEITDDNENVIVSFANGGVRTKNFNSADFESSSEPTDFNGQDIRIFTSGICVGDSMTAGTFNYSDDGDGASGYVDIPKHSYPTKLSEMLGITLTNKGVGGYTSVQWYEAMQNVDLSGNDFAIIQLGINDQSVYGGWTNASKTAFTNIINKLKSENEGIKIYVATIIPAINYGGRSAISQGIRDLVAELDDDNVILLDMALYSHVGDNVAYESGHLSAYGYFVLAQDYFKYISWHIANNKMLYRKVQFIGTNYQYN